jgi:4-azaleucine resistance transporter AzlC
VLNPWRMAPHRRDGFLLAAACFFIGITFGIFSESTGLSLGKASALSLLTFTGASQFAAVSVVAGGGTTAAAVGGAVLIGARHALYGPVVSPLLHGGRFRRALGAHFVIDETTAMASVQEDADTAGDAFWFTGLWLFVFWNVGTVLGVLAGGAFDDPGALGLDAAFPAAFVAMLAPHLRTRPGWVTAIGGGAIALVAVPTTAAGVPMLLGALAILPGLWVGRRSGGSVPRDQSAGSAP